MDEINERLERYSLSGSLFLSFINVDEVKNLTIVFYSLCNDFNLNKSGILFCFSLIHSHFKMQVEIKTTRTSNLESSLRNYL